MLSVEENEAITRVGAGTIMGNLFRQFWLPALLSRELPSPDSDPVRVLMLGEKLIAFRTTDGNVGLVQNHCPHRGASLFFGRNEESGLRCVYHGWKFDVTGQCVDMPNEPAESNFKNKVKALAYPCIERNGIVWTYMGPRTTPPELPHIEANMIEGAVVNAVQLECNWLQGLEGDFDTSHAGFLHNGAWTADMLKPGTFDYYAQRDRSPRYGVVDTEVGVRYTAFRDAEPGYEYHRIGTFFLPCVSMPAANGILGPKVGAGYRVPMDDTHTLAFQMNQPATYQGERGAALFARGRAGQSYSESSTDWYGRFRTVRDASNDYQIDRDKQRRNVTFTGIAGTGMQDRMVTESAGPIYDRSTERLGTSDAMVIQLRRRLLNAARDLAERGITPPGVDNPAAYSERTGGIILPKGADWNEVTSELRKGFIDHPEANERVAIESAAPVIPRD